jgi:hypothetical protein
LSRTSTSAAYYQSYAIYVSVLELVYNDNLKVLLFMISESLHLYFLGCCRGPKFCKRGGSFELCCGHE